MTAALLIIVLIFLEHRSPLQSAISRSAPSAKPYAPAAPPSAQSSPKEAPPSDGPDPFTFYETLPQLNKDAPGLTDLAPAPKADASSARSNTTASSAAAPKTSSSRYTVQVAAMADRSKAEALAARLKQKGYDVSIRPHVVPKRGTWYRVRVGHFKDRQAAQEFARRLSKQEGLAAYLALE